MQPITERRPRKFVETSRSEVPELKNMRSLPIYSVLPQIMESIEKNPITIVTTPTGSGKSSLTAKLVLEGISGILIAEPTRSLTNNYSKAAERTIPKKVEQGESKLPQEIKQENGNFFVEYFDPEEASVVSVVLEMPKNASPEEFERKLQTADKSEFYKEGVLIKPKMIIPESEQVGIHTRTTKEYTSNQPARAVTDGMAMNYLKDDPLLAKWNVIVFDEFDRSQEGQQKLFAWCKYLQDSDLRPDLRIVITSATLNLDTLKKHAGISDGSEAIISLENNERENKPQRIFTEERQYNLESLSDAEKFVMNKLPEAIKVTSEAEAIMVFVTSINQIYNLEGKILNQSFEKEGGETVQIEVCTYHGQMNPEDLQKVRETPIPKGFVRIILATDAAASGINPQFPVTACICADTVNRSSFDPKSRQERITMQKASKALIEQEEGRMGRIGFKSKGHNVAFHMATEADFAKLPTYELTSFERDNIDKPILEIANLLLNAKEEMLKAGDYTLEEIEEKCNIMNFSFPFEIPKGKLEATVNFLQQKGLLDVNNQVTKLGKFVVNLPVSVESGIMLQKSFDRNFSLPIAIIASVVQLNKPLFEHGGSSQAILQQYGLQAGLLAHKIKDLTDELNKLKDHLRESESTQNINTTEENITDQINMLAKELASLPRDSEEYREKFDNLIELKNQPKNGFKGIDNQARKNNVIQDQIANCEAELVKCREALEVQKKSYPQSDLLVGFEIVKAFLLANNSKREELCQIFSLRRDSIEECITNYKEITRNLRQKGNQVIGRDYFGELDLQQLIKLHAGIGDCVLAAYGHLGAISTTQNTARSGYRFNNYKSLQSHDTLLPSSNSYLDQKRENIPQLVVATHSYTNDKGKMLMKWVHPITLETLLNNPEVGTPTAKLRPDGVKFDPKTGELNESYDIWYTNSDTGKATKVAVEYKKIEDIELLVEHFADYLSKHVYISQNLPFAYDNGQAFIKYRKIELKSEGVISPKDESLTLKNFYIQKLTELGNLHKISDLENVDQELLSISLQDIDPENYEDLEMFDKLNPDEYNFFGSKLEVKYTRESDKYFANVVLDYSLAEKISEQVEGQIFLDSGRELTFCLVSDYSKRYSFSELEGIVRAEKLKRAYQEAQQVLSMEDKLIKPINSLADFKKMQDEDPTYAAMSYYSEAYKIQLVFYAGVIIKDDRYYLKYFGTKEEADKKTEYTFAVLEKVEQRKKQEEKEKKLEKQQELIKPEIQKFIDFCNQNYKSKYKEREIDFSKIYRSAGIATLAELKVKVGQTEKLLARMVINTSPDNYSNEYSTALQLYKDKSESEFLEYNRVHNQFLEGEISTEIVDKGLIRTEVEIEVNEKSDTYQDQKEKAERRLLMPNTTWGKGWFELVEGRWQCTINKDGNTFVYIVKNGTRLPQEGMTEPYYFELTEDEVTEDIQKTTGGADYVSFVVLQVPWAEDSPREIQKRKQAALKAANTQNSASDQRATSAAEAAHQADLLAKLKGKYGTGNNKSKRR